MSARDAVRVRCRPLLLVGLVLLPGTGFLSKPASASEKNRPRVNVGVVFDGPPPDAEHPAPEGHAELLGRIEGETRSLTRRDFDVRFPEDKRLSGGWDLERIRSGIDRLLRDPEVDVVVALGPFTTNDAVKRGALPKPVVGTWGIDRNTQRLPAVETAGGRYVSGVENVCYVIVPGNSVKDLEKFGEIVPLSRVHILVDALFCEAIPDLVDYAADAGRELGLELVLVAVEEDPDEALARIPPDAEAVYVTPLGRMSPVDFDRLVAGLIERRLPSFSLTGRLDVERGILGGLRPATDLRRLARRVALNIQRILLGERAEDLPLELPLQGGLVINMATARALGVSPPWRIMIEAERLFDEPSEVARTLRLADVVREAVKTNVDLAVADRTVAAGAQNIALARSRLLPRIDFSARGVQVDEDRAGVFQAERTLTGGVSLTQLLYSDGARAGVDVSKRVQGSLEWEREVQRLDVALAAASAYLDVLRARTLERVATDNLRLTESNLELARRRVAIGQSGPADVYRWESELATDRSTAIAAENRTLAARAVLNRVLNRPIEEVFAARAPSLGDPELVVADERLAPFYEGPVNYALFRDFLVREGLAASPELKAVDDAVAAQERAVLAARRSYWSPEVALRGEFERDVSTGGTGSGGLPPPFDTDDESWNVALQATLPLFTGGERRAELRQASEELSALRHERAALAERIELRIRLAAFEAGSSFPAIRLANEAAEAAGKNLELVTDAYSRGVVSVIDLLDAQNAALVADEFASNAVFDFLLDLMEVQRATANFDFFGSEEGREAWIERLEAFFEESGVVIHRGSEERR